MADWAKDWQTLTEKPMGVIQGRDYKTVAGRDDVLDAMLGLSKGTKAQAACDPADAPRASKATKDDNLDVRNGKFTTNLKLFKSDMGKMLTALKKMLAATDKGTQADLYRNLKILITGGEAFQARMEQHAKTWGANAKDSKSYDKVQEISDPEDKKAASEKRALEIELRDLKVKLNATIKKAAAAIQRIKSELTPANYNKEIDKGGRDLYMTLVAIRTVKADSKLGKTSDAKKIPDPGTHVAALKEFGESAGNYRKLADNATANDVTVALKAFSAAVKAVIVDYTKFLKL